MQRYRLWLSIAVVAVALAVGTWLVIKGSRPAVSGTGNPAGSAPAPATASSRQPSKEAKAIVDMLRANLERGFAIGYERPLGRLRELGEEEHAVPVLLAFIAPRQRQGLRVGTAIECLGMLGSSARSAAPAMLEAMKGMNPFDRDPVVKALVAISPPAETVMPQLLELLNSKDANLRRCAISILGSLGPAAATEALPRLSALAADKSESADSRRAVVWALVQIGWPQSRDVVFRLLGDQNDWQGAEAASAALYRLGPAAAPVAADLAAAIGRPGAASALKQLGADGREAVPLLVKALDNPETAPAAADALAEIGLNDEAMAAAATPALARLAATSDYLVKIDAVEALGGAVRPTDPIVAVLQAALTDKSDLVRHQAARSLGRLRVGKPEVVAELTRRLADPDPHVAKAAARALAQIGDAARPALPDLRKATEARDGQLRIAAAEALWRIDSQAEVAAPILLAALAKGGDDRGDDWAAIEALQRIKSPRPDVIEGLTRVLAADSAYNSKVYATQALAELGPDAKTALPTLRKLLTGGREHPRIEAAAAIHKIAGDGSDDIALARRVLISVLEEHGEGEHDWRRPAAKALLGMTPNADPTLVRKLSADADPGIRAMVARVSAKQ